MTISKTFQPVQDAAESGVENEPVASVDAGIQGALGRKLRESYEEVVREDVPDKFLKLLNELKTAEEQGGNATDKADKG